MMNKIINFNYEGNEIPFRIDENGEVFMNATKMMEPFSEKRMHNFTRNKTTLEYINALHEIKAITPISVIEDSQLVIKPDNQRYKSGTWFHKDLAIYFAQWLNPKFSVWCNQRIDEIITRGFSALTPEGTDYIENL